METHTQELKAVGLTGTGASLHPGWKLVLSPQTDPQPPVVVLESPSHMGTTQGQAPAFQQVDRLLGAQVTAPLSPQPHWLLWLESRLGVQSLLAIFSHECLSQTKEAEAVRGTVGGSLGRGWGAGAGWASKG